MEFFMTMREALTEEVTFEHGPEGGEGWGHMGPWEKSILGSENSLCKGPEVWSCLAWMRKSVEASVAGVEYVCVLRGGRGKVEDEVGVRGSRSSGRALLSLRRLCVISWMGWEPQEGSEQRRNRT